MGGWVERLRKGTTGREDRGGRVKKRRKRREEKEKGERRKRMLVLLTWSAPAVCPEVVA